MTADDFIGIVRDGGDKLRVDDVVIDTGDQQFHGKGILQITREDFEVKVTLRPGEHLPELRSGIYTKKDTWRLSGIIEDQLGFRCEHIGPAGLQSLSLPGEIRRCKFRLNPIHLVPTGWDAMSRADRHEFWRTHAPEQQSPNAEPGPAGNVAEDAKQDVSFQATLMEYPWISSKQGTEATGETGFFKFILTKQENNDVRVTLNSKDSYLSKGEDADWEGFHAFMNGLALMTGTHAWPFQASYWCAGQKLTERVMAASKLAKTSHAPFDKRLAFNAVTGQVKWDFGDTLGKAAAFFERDTSLSREVSQILFLFRQADAGVQSQVTTIALCVLFENLIQVAFRELGLESMLQSEVASFNEARTEVLKYVASRIAARHPGGTEGCARIQAILQPAQGYVMKQMFRTLVDHLGLKWDGAILNQSLAP